MINLQKINKGENKMMKVLKQKKFFAGVMLFILTGTSTMVGAAAKSYTNAKTFNDVALPHEYENVTLASAKKTTGNDYGKLHVTKIGGGSKGINVWLRSKKANGEWDVLNSKMRSFTEPGTKELYYTNQDTKYKIPYSKGTSAQVRGENKTRTTLIHDHVSGVAYFN